MDNSHKKNLITILFFVGLAIQMAALFGEHADEIPFIMRIIAPNYYHAVHGIKKFDETEALQKEDEGFKEISDLIIDNCSQKFGLHLNGKALSAKDVRSSHITIVKITLGTAERTGAKPVNPYLKCSMICPLAPNSVEGDVYESDLLELISDSKNPNILVFCFGLFFFGSGLEVLAFIVESKEKGDDHKNDANESGKKEHQEEPAAK